jgi:hypothetical protein
LASLVVFCAVYSFIFAFGPTSSQKILGLRLRLKETARSQSPSTDVNYPKAVSLFSHAGHLIFSSVRYRR